MELYKNSKGSSQTQTPEIGGYIQTWKEGTVRMRCIMSFLVLHSVQPPELADISSQAVVH